MIKSNAYPDSTLISYLKTTGTLFLLLLDVVVRGDIKDSSQAHRNKLSQSDHLELIRKSMPLLENKTLTVCVIVREPFVIFNGSNSTIDEANIDNYSGIAMEVVKRLSLIFGFHVRIIRPSDNQFGVLIDGRWTGLMGSLVAHESDIGATALSITVGRAHVIDFTRAYYVETAGILLRIPEEVKNYLAIFEPFSSGAWILLLTTMILLILCITGMTRLEDSQDSHNQPLNDLDDTASSDPRTKVVQFLPLKTLRRRSRFGTTWLERFYYAVTCVINILLIRGESISAELLVELILYCLAISVCI